MKKDFDIIIIGAGPGGYVAAIKAAKAGLETALVESRDIGGTCLNRGCIPTKAMIHATSTFREAREGSCFGVDADRVTFDYGRMLEYRDETIDTLVSGIEQLLKANGVKVIEGRGTLQPAEEGLNVVSVSSEDGSREVYGTENVVLATGSQPATLPIDGSELDRVINSDELFALDKAPGSLIIVGGGVIGVELASVFSNLGTEVIILEALPRILENFDKEISRNLQMIMKKRGVDIHASARVMSFEEADGGVRCLYEEKDKPCEATAEYVMVATGRRPMIEGLFGEGITLGTDIQMDGKFIAVNQDMETDMEGVYAIGDLIGGMQLAHAASAHGIRVIEKITGEEYSQEIDMIPGGVYTDPEIASVGMTEAQAKDEGRQIKIGKFIMSANGKSLITKEDRGFIKVIIDDETEKILGAQMMCARATDMIGEFTTAMAADLSASDMLRSVRAHPTYNEAIGEALEDGLGESIHTMPKRRK